MRKYILKTLNGMTYGLFATLIVGTIIGQIGKLIGIDNITSNIELLLKGLLGAGVGLGIALSLKKEGLKLIIGIIVGSIATLFSFNFSNAEFNFKTFGVHVGNPVTIYFVVTLTYFIFDLIFKKKTPIDLILIPIGSVVFSFLLTMLISHPVDYLMKELGRGIDSATKIQPILMSIVISVSMGMILTSPISSAAVAISINLSGIAAGAAVIGTSVQMLGIAIQSIKDTKVGDVISIGIGTSMLQFKNLVKKPIIWLPTIIASAILAPIYYLIFKIESTSIGAGMGTSALVGQFQVLETMDYSVNAWLSVISMFIVIPGLVYLIDLFFRKIGWIKKGDFKLDVDF